jgi:hypothetical protein
MAERTRPVISGCPRRARLSKRRELDSNRELCDDGATDHLETAMPDTRTPEQILQARLDGALEHVNELRAKLGAQPKLTPLTGQSLYAIWSAANEAHNCGVSAWAEMDAFDQECWDTFAELLNDRSAS